MKKLFFIPLYLFLFSACAQESDSAFIKKIFKSGLTNNTAYENLRYLCKKIGNRITGSPQSIAAVEFTKQIMQELKPDTVYLQETITNYWYRGDLEYGAVISSKLGIKELKIASLGNSIATGDNGINAEIIEVHSETELNNLGQNKIQGKIVFFNIPMNSALNNPFSAYGEVARYRFAGATMAAQYGAVAVIIRSLTMQDDEFPHTGVMRYFDSKQIPAVSICTKHANLLSNWLKLDPKLTFLLKTDCRIMKNVKTFNVVGEIKGSEKPEEIITVGGHIDCWDLGEGAHDDGAGCVQSIDVLRIFKKLHYKPKRTIRIVMFMDEEINQCGGRKYAELASLKKEKLIFALEADEGGATPFGFSFDANDKQIAKYQSWRKYFTEYGIHQFEKGGGGVDISFMKGINQVVLSGLQTDPNRYFDYHHCGNDTFEQINKRELQLGSCAMTALIYLIDTYGN